MAGTLFLKEVPIYTLSTSNAASLAAGAATTVIGTTLDCRSSGANSPEAAVAMFQLTASWNVTTGITVGTDIADLYLLPALDGTNYPAIGTSQVSPAQYVASFINPTTTVAVSTNILFTTPIVELFPTLYTAAIVNQSGQALNSSWILKVVTAQGNYT
jgi:hypothetical protein